MNASRRPPDPRVARLAPLAALVATVVLVLSACGSTGSSTTATDGESTPGPTTSPTSGPSTGPTTSPTSPTSSAPTSPTSSTSSPPTTLADCSDVWVDGKVLPGSYHGCLKSGKKVRGRPIYCEQGNRLYLYAGTYYALASHPVRKSPEGLKKDDAFRTLVHSCTG